ncbi:hypothetical protein BGC07_10075 [Piscirickettsia litoralis]|uniref:Major facilitator superfamily (MFS) profile domain-containing protein n=1 Tax=Piscirickettsia litoralis TaxID=1891921 RepID=A0ABX3A2W1_9GAMM|nr:hypothetical protein BGC07_10075 [Piscirickettsia litoralis]
MRDLGLSVGSATFIISCYGVGKILGGFLSGKLVDKFSANSVSAVSLLIMAFLFLIMAYLRDVYSLSLSGLIIGILAYGFITSNSVWVLNSCEKSSKMKLKAINMLSVSSNLGIGIAAAIVSLFAVAGFIIIFYISFFSLLTASIFLFLQDKHSDSLGNDFSEELSSDKKRGNKKVLLLALGCLFFIGIAVAEKTALYVVYLHQNFPQYSISLIGLLFMLNPIMVVFAQAPIVNSFQNKNKILVLGLGAFLMGLGLIVLCFSFVFVIAVISMIVWTIGEMLIFFSCSIVDLSASNS